MNKCTLFNPKDFVVLGLTGNHDLDVKIVKEINNESHANLGFHYLNMGYYPDQEIDNRIPENEKLKGKNVIIFQSTYSQELMLELIDMVWAAKHEYSAKKVIVVMPFMHYRRQDSEDKAEINRSKWLAQNLAWNGADVVILCDIHSQATIKHFEDAGIEVYNVDPNRVYAKHLIVPMQIAKEDGRELCIYVPDEGSISRGIPLAKLLGARIAINQKEREEDGDVKIIYDEDRLKELEKIHGVELVVVDESFKGVSFVMREDELSTGGTAATFGKHLMKVIKAFEVIFIATHPVCSDSWKRKVIDNSPFKNILLGNTIPRKFLNSTGGRVTNVNIAHEIAVKIISVMHEIS